MGLPAVESNGRSQDTEALYREHGAAVGALCRSLLRDRAEAEDATQQVFLSAHRALVNGSTPREPLAWLLAVARHECYARYRRRATSPVPAGDVPEGETPDASVQAVRAGELAAVWDEVGQMPAAQREAFLLREIRGLSYGQLTEELSLSAASVRSLLLRARARLRHRLRDAAAGLGALPWVQALVAGGDGTPPVSAATKAAAVGIGALALVGGGDVARVTHHASSGQARSRHEVQTRVPRALAPTAVAVAPGESRPQRDVQRSEREHSRAHDDGSGGSTSGSSGSRDRSGDGGTALSDRSNDTTVVTQSTTTTSGSDGGGGGTSTTSGRDGSTDSSSGGGSSDGGSSGSSSGSDGGSGSTTTTTSSGSDGSGSSGRDGHGG